MAGKEKENIVRSRHVSFRDIHIAKVTANTETEYTTDTPSKMARAISGTITDSFTSEKIYSDDTVEDVNMSYQGTNVELEVNSLAPQDRRDIYGNMYSKGYLVKNKDDKAPEIALGYRSKMLNGKYEFVWLYCGKFAQGSEKKYQTQQGETNTQTNTLNGEFYERQLDGNYQISVDEGNLIEEYTEAAEAIKNWFGQVQEYPEDSTEEPGTEEPGNQTE